MRPSYKVLIHEKVKQQLRDFVTSQQKSEQDSIVKQIKTALEKLKNDPLGPSNSLFQESRYPRLCGKIRKIHVGGRERFRLINLCISEKETVLPIYISEVRRSDFDYNKVPWQSIAEEIYKDLIDGNKDKFCTI